jgi:hypothetical protein
MDHRDDARAAELNNLRLALVTFALQLDVFESHGPTPDCGLRKEA